ncbi:mechanosensitive ion channel family protein [Pseudonocardia sichuanensis]
MFDNLTAALGDAMRAVAVFVPQLVLFLVILLIGWLIAKGLRKLTDTVLERVHFDRAVERGGIGRALARSQYDASDLIALVVYYAVLLLTLQLAFGVFGPNPISALLTGIVAFLPRIAVAIIIVVVASAIAAAVKDLITGAMGGLSYGRVLATIASVFIIGLGVIAALSQIGVAVAVTLPVLITVLATVGGILVVGVGGGLVRPMQQRWERWLARAEEEAPQARAHAQAYERGREDATRPGATARADVTDPVGTRVDPTVDPAADPTADLRKS